MPASMQIRPLSFRARAQTAPVMAAHRSSPLDVKRWDVYQPATPWDGLRRVSIPKMSLELLTYKLLGCRAMVTIWRLHSPPLRQRPVSTWSILQSLISVSSQCSLHRCSPDCLISVILLPDLTSQQQLYNTCHKSARSAARIS